jgi:hypothetical protein
MCTLITDFLIMKLHINRWFEPRKIAREVIQIGLDLLKAYNKELHGGSVEPTKEKMDSNKIPLLE